LEEFDCVDGSVDSSEKGAAVFLLPPPVSPL
jgi:hypothetical protein